MTSHRVVTFERQGGYAARCEDCDGITFGGFPSRSAAREALTHEETPARVAARPGSVSETHQKETNMSIISNSETNDQQVVPQAHKDWAAEVRRLFGEHAQPIRSSDDPRALDLVGSRPGLMSLEQIDWFIADDPEFNPQLLADDYFNLHLELLPPLPFKVPVWALETEGQGVFSRPGYGGEECSVWIYGWSQVFGPFEGRRAQYVTVDLLTGKVTFYPEEFMIRGTEDLDIEPSEAVELAKLLEALLTENPRVLRRPAQTDDQLRAIDG